MSWFRRKLTSAAGLESAIADRLYGCEIMDILGKEDG